MNAVGECVVPLAVRPVGTAGCEPASDHLDRRRDVLDCVVAPCEQALVRAGRRVGAGCVELRPPEEVGVRLVPDDDVLDLRHEARHRGRERGEVRLLRVGHRRLAAELRDVDDRRDRLGDGRACCPPQRVALDGRQFPKRRSPEGAERDRAEAGAARALHVGARRCVGRSELGLVLDGTDDEPSRRRRRVGGCGRRRRGRRLREGRRHRVGDGRRRRHRARDRCRLGRRLRRARMATAGEREHDESDECRPRAHPGCVAATR